MAQQRRSVRFVPMGLEDSLDPAPVFSPTQMDTDTSVLHSVFSPTAKQRQQGISYNPTRNERTSDSYLEPASTAGGFTMQQDNHKASTVYFGSAYNGYSSKSPSPLRPATLRRLHVNTADASLSSTITNEIFYSPQSSLDMDSPRSVVSGFTHKTSSSFKSLRDVTLLDLDNIKKCNSVLDLENVIQVLSGEGKFQALLRMAKNRLQTVLGSGDGAGGQLKEAYLKPLPTQKIHETQVNTKQQTVQNSLDWSLKSTAQRSPKPRRVPSTSLLRASPNRSSAISESFKQSSQLAESPKNNFVTIHVEPSPAASPRQQALDNEKGLLDEGTLALSETNDSSLIMSLSSSMIDDDPQLDDHHQLQIDRVPAINRKFERRQTSTNHTYVSASPSPTARYDKKLSDDLKKLTDAVLSMEKARAEDRKAFLEKLVALESEKNGENLRTIEAMMKKSSENTRDLLNSLEQLRTESQELQETMRAERMTWRQSHTEAQQLESRLCRKVDELAQALSSQPSQASKEKEEKVRLQYLTEIAIMQKAHEKTLGKLLVGLGRNKNELRTMTQHQKDELVSFFVKNTMSTKAATEAMAQEIATLEKERQEASRAKQALAVHMEKSKRSQALLEHENLQLHQKIQNLSQELEDMKKHAKELSSSRTQMDDWEQQEKKYRDMIRSLKSQLRKEETSKCF
jgi:hypothetical protein